MKEVPMAPLRKVIGRLLQELWDGRMNLDEYERRVAEASDRQQPLELGMGAAMPDAAPANTAAERSLE